jgi:small ligand-binding sensory domain FIST
VALVKAIQSSNFTVARKHLPAHQLPATPPGASEVKDYFHGLALNYPRTATVVGGLVKGGQARIEIQGVDNEGKKIKGPVGLTKTEGVWRVVDQGFMFTE